MDKDSILHLLQGYRDASISEEEARELAGLIRAGGEEADLILEDIRISGQITQALDDTDTADFQRAFMERLHAEKDSDKFVAAFNAKSRPRRRKAGTTPFIYKLAAMAAGIALALGLLLLMTQSDAPEFLNAQLSEMQKDVTITRASEDLIVSHGLEIADQDNLNTGPESGATVKYAVEKTQVRAFADTRVVFKMENGAKIVELLEGHVRCTVAKQPEGKPFILRTLHADAEVLGTDFEAKADKDKSTLTVNEGKVKYTRREDGKSVLVARGETATAAPGIEMAVKPAGAGGKLASPVWNIKVISDKVEDITTMDAWMKSSIKPGMTDEEKAVAVWETVVKFRQQTTPPSDYMNAEGHPHDPIKNFNVYGYGFCGCAASHVTALARYAGLKARGKGISSHSVPEIYYDNDWHLFDASLICWFRDKEGAIASVDEIIASVREWYTANPGFEGDPKKIYSVMRNEQWKKGPAVLASSKFYSTNGWLPALTHGWNSTLMEYDGKSNFEYEYGYSLGYKALFSLRPGEIMTRNWSHKGLHANMDTDKDHPMLHGIVGKGDMGYSPQYGDLANGRVGNGTLIYTVPLQNGAWRNDAFTVSGLTDGPGIKAADPAAGGNAVFRIHSPYLFLKSSIQVAGTGTGSLNAEFSANNGLTWHSLTTLNNPGAFNETLDPGFKILRRFDYYIRLTVNGSLRIDKLAFNNDIQHSQRALPALDMGENTITVDTGQPLDTITIEPSLHEKLDGKAEGLDDFRPELKGLRRAHNALWVQGYGADKPGLLTFTVEAPGDIRAVRFGGHLRARGKKDAVRYMLSFDNGGKWIPVTDIPGPYTGFCKYVQFMDVPPESRKVLVRYHMIQGENTTGIMALRIDVDYWATPDGRPAPSPSPTPLKIMYTWEEDGREKTDTHITAKPEESYTINCAAKPKMKSITVELAE